MPLSVTDFFLTRLHVPSLEGLIADTRNVNDGLLTSPLGVLLVVDGLITYGRCGVRSRAMLAVLMSELPKIACCSYCMP